MRDVDTIMTVMAFPRAGTNMLGWAIHSHPQMHYVSELFHPRKHCGHPRTAADVVAAIERYDEPGAAVLCLDTKYNQITPALEEFLRGVKVIHLVRRDTLRHWFSFKFRTHRKHPERGAIAFDRDEYERFLRRVTRLREKLSYLEDLRLVYEDLTGDRQISALPEWASRRICDLAGVDFYPLTTHTKKGAPMDIEGLW